MHRVAETPAYLANAERLFTDAERAMIVDLLASHPHRGVVIPGTGGIRKLRFGFAGRGKSGGARVIYLFGGGDIPIFLLAAFAKNEQADLAPRERAALGRIAAAMVADYRSRT